MYPNVSMQMLGMVGESDHAPTVCVIGRWVASIFPRFVTYITGV